MGRKGRNKLPPTTLNMLPKLELAAILMYLMMLPKTLRPSMTPCSSTSRLFSSKMMSEDFLGDVHRRIDRDAHVGGAEGRGVVDAIAQEADHVPVALQGADDALLVRRRELGKDGGAVDGLRQLGVGHLFDGGAEQDLVNGQAYLPADGRGHQFVVAGEDAHLDVMLVQLGEARRRSWPWAGRGNARKPFRVSSDSSRTE